MLINEEKLGTACIRLLQSRRGTAAWLLCVATVMVAFALGKFWDLQRQLAGLKEALRLEKLKAENFAASHEGVPSINGEQERQDEHADSSDNESEQQDEVKAALHSLDRIAAELPKEEERVETLREKVARLETLNEERMVLEPKVNTLRKAEEEMADCEKHIEAMEERLKKLPELRLKERGLLEKSTETEDLIAKVESMMGKAAIIDVVTDVHNRMKEDADAADRMLMDMKGTEGQLERARAEYVDKETRIKDEIEKLQMNLNQRLPMLEKERDELQAKARDLASTPGLESATAVPPGSVVATSAVELDTRKNDRSMRKMKQSQLDAKMEDMLAKLEGEKKRLEEALAAEREQSASWTRKAQQAQQTLSNLKRRMQESSRTGHLQLSYRSLYQTETPMVSLGVLKKPQETCNENAYAVLVMRGDKYALGAAVVAYQLKQLNARADVVCLVTREVSPEARQALSTVFDAIYECPLVQFDCIEMTTQKQRDFYGEWISESFTKWNVLLLTMYKKVLLVDADLLPLTNIDNLFTLNAPAATFSSPWSSEYKGGGGYDDPYKGLVHGRSVDQQMIFSAIDASLRYDKGGKGSYVGLGSLVLVEPSADQFQSLLAFVSARQPFGVPGCHSGFDEQSIVFYFNAHHPNRGWTHISQEYNCLAWHRKWIRGAQPKCYHYFNEKPWTQHPQSYEDVPVWYDAAAGLRKSHPETEVLFEKCLKDMNFIESHIVGPSSKGRNS
ncbi:unnamed protein product [Ostreobium quekettii]|uniref:Uncharacterized protein n=1 Tax=Ostreobium quekettii TaxID=121088 RepID=A0A8S1J196_9CHLO|nr:unnamed protein product [Ostreobium quekettii]